MKYNQTWRSFQKQEKITSYFKRSMQNEILKVIQKGKNRGKPKNKIMKVIYKDRDIREYIQKLKESGSKKLIMDINRIFNHNPNVK
jgi:hypothetical protein